jgi:catechol 2,3-dioxygenase-like lactoylglutathione lyase family enzyme
MAVRGIDHVVVTVADVERTVTFYVDVLGAEVQRLDQFRRGDADNITLVIGANRINVHPFPPRTEPRLVARQPTPGSADLCFRWDGAIEAAIDLLTAHGLPLVEGPVPRQVLDGSSAVSIYTRDPDGNLIEFLTSD